MKSGIRVSLFVSVTLFLCASFLIVGNVLTRSAQNPPQTTSSLQERAKRDGKVVIKVFPRLNRYDTLEALKKDTSAIIVGTAISRASRVGTHSENSVSTDYSIRVDETLKGDLQKDTVVRVNEVGGKLQYENGSYAEMVLPDYWKTPQLQKTYVLFLNKRDGGDYRLVGGPQGLFEVSASDLLKPQGLATDELFRAHNGMTLKKFSERLGTNVEERAARAAKLVKR